MQTSGIAFFTAAHVNPGSSFSHSPFPTQMSEMTGNAFESFGKDFQRKSTLSGISSERVTNSQDFSQNGALAARAVPMLINHNPFEPTEFDPGMPPFPNFPSQPSFPPFGHVSPFQACRPPKEEIDPTKFQPNATVETVKIENGGTTITVGPGGCVKI